MTLIKVKEKLPKEYERLKKKDTTERTFKGIQDYSRAAKAMAVKGTVREEAAATSKETTVVLKLNASSVARSDIISGTVVMKPRKTTLCLLRVKNGVLVDLFTAVLRRT